jgi:hypothetical protein
MPKEQKTASELARLVQAETVRHGGECDVMIERDRNVRWTASALASPSRAAELQGYLDASRMICEKHTAEAAVDCAARHADEVIE